MAFIIAQTFHIDVVTIKRYQTRVLVWYIIVRQHIVLQLSALQIFNQ